MCLILANMSYEQKDLTPSEKHILLILCLRADSKTKSCFPSIRSLMNDSALSRAQVTRNLSELREKKKIIDIGRCGKTKSIVVYKILINKQAHVEPSSIGKQAHFEDKQAHHESSKQAHGELLKDHVFKDHRKDVFQKSSGPKHISGLFDILK